MNKRKWICLPLFLSLIIAPALGSAQICEDLFVKNEASISFPAPLKISSDFLQFLETTNSYGSLTLISRILQVDAYLKDLAPIGLRRAISLRNEAILSPDTAQRIADFDIQNIQHLRAYTILKELSRIAATKDDSVLQLTDQEVQMWAVLVARLMPASFPQTLNVKIESLTPVLRKRIELALQADRYRRALAQSLRAGLDLNLSIADIGLTSKVIPLTLHQNRPSISVQTTSADKIERVIEKLENSRSLNVKDVDQLQILVLRMFLVSAGETAVSLLMKPSVIHELSVNTVNKTMNSQLMALSTENKSLVDSIMLFEFLILGVPLPLSLSHYQQELYKTVEAHYFADLRRQWSAQLNEFRSMQQAALREAEAQRLAQLRNDPDIRILKLTTPSTVEPQMPKEKVKTRGVADPSREQHVQTTDDEPRETRIESLIEMKELAPQLMSPDEPYVVRFQRHQEQYPKDQTFVFAKDVVKWLQENPHLALEFLEAIHAGPTVKDYAQSGIKFMTDSRYEGYPLYEVKIQSKHFRYRMLLTLREGVWHAHNVLHRDKLKHN